MVNLPNCEPYVRTQQWKWIIEIKNEILCITKKLIIILFLIKVLYWFTSWLELRLYTKMPEQMIKVLLILLFITEVMPTNMQYWLGTTKIGSNYPALALYLTYYTGFSFTYYCPWGSSIQRCYYYSSYVCTSESYLAH